MNLQFVAFARRHGAREVLASFVVFLVALPLCLGIAIASGLPPAAGLISGVVGGLVVGALAGSPLQVSGPAAGLTVLVYQIVQDHGVASLGVVVLLAGLIQFAAGLLRAGRYFRAVPPAVIAGMLAGIGLLIIAGQWHVMLGLAPRGSGLENLLAIPGSLLHLVSSESAAHAAATAAIVFATMALWPTLASRLPGLRWLPSALLAVALGTGAAHLLGFDVPRVQLPDNLLEAVALPDGGFFSKLLQPSLLGAALALALIASAETLLCAAAVDRMHDGPRTRYDRELVAQGVGNAVCGLFGTLPVTGVIVRSSANVQAGARTRASAILHGVWLLILVGLAPAMLRLIPLAALAGLLLFTGYKLLRQDLRPFAAAGHYQIAIYLGTIAAIVATDLLKGVLFGLTMAAGGLLWSFSHLKVRTVESAGRVDVMLFGAATFLQLPELTAALERVPREAEAHIHLEGLDFLDHAALEAFSSWEKQHLQRGGRVSLDWESLHHRLRSPRERIAQVANAPAPGAESSRWRTRERRAEV